MRWISKRVAKASMAVSSLLRERSLASAIPPGHSEESHSEVSGILKLMFAQHIEKQNLMNTHHCREPPGEF